jgi:hypothetical protein
MRSFILWAVMTSLKKNNCVPVGGSMFRKPLEVLELDYMHVPKDVFKEFLQGIVSRYSLTYDDCF